MFGLKLFTKTKTKKFASDKARKCGISMEELHGLLDLVNEGEEVSS